MTDTCDLLHGHDALSEMLDEAQRKIGGGGNPVFPRTAGYAGVTLGDVIEDYAFTAKAPVEFRIQGLTREEQRVYQDVERYRFKFDERNPIGPRLACKDLGESYAVYDKARSIAEATQGEAFSCKGDALIKPTDAIVTGYRNPNRRKR